MSGKNLFELKDLVFSMESPGFRDRLKGGCPFENKCCNPKGISCFENACISLAIMSSRLSRSQGERLKKQHSHMTPASSDCVV